MGKRFAAQLACELSKRAEPNWAPKQVSNATGATDVERQIQQVLATKVDVVSLRHRSFRLERVGLNA